MLIPRQPTCGRRCRLLRFLLLARLALVFFVYRPRPSCTPCAARAGRLQFSSSPPHALPTLLSAKRELIFRASGETPLLAYVAARTVPISAHRGLFFAFNQLLRHSGESYALYDILTRALTRAASSSILLSLAHPHPHPHLSLRTTPYSPRIGSGMCNSDLNLHLHAQCTPIPAPPFPFLRHAIATPYPRSHRRPNPINIWHAILSTSLVPSIILDAPPAQPHPPVVHSTVHDPQSTIHPRRPLPVHRTP
ncbi:hypothetical protein K438DRAFT_1962058 [Mycena galopus ATCC 62051]|nr:hypothetical protein K438DRAFT_1962058 [Mycena galopus ATCC 62051]